MLSLRRLAALHLITLLSCGRALAADPAPFNSREVHADGSVTFRLRDAGATKVEVTVANLPDPLPLAKADGIWSVTTPPLDPSLYWYSFVVNGHAQLDPVNPEVYPNLSFLNSFVAVTGKDPLPWVERDVPHGAVHHHYYTSKLVKGLPGGHSDFLVYTPPGYDPKGVPYPVLYLLHGFGQTAANWTLEGRAHVILDNLLSEGRARPMLVVMPFGYGDMSVLPFNWDAKIAENDRQFGRVLTEEVMPAVESAYNVSRDRGSRAIAGLSMGGLQSLEIGLNHPDLFAYIGGFSASASEFHDTAFTAALTPKAAAYRLLWFGCGTGEIFKDGDKVDDNLADNRKVEAALRARGFEVEDVPLPGMHTWKVWHECLNRFAPLLFRGP
jgi:enterochelin esterase family protein